MSNRGPFKGLWAAKLPNTPCWAAGSTWHTLKGSRAALTKSNPKKKKKNLFLSQSSKTCPGNILEAATADQSSQVKSNPDP